MSWDNPTEMVNGVPETVTVRGDGACPWCGGTGHFACTIDRSRMDQPHGAHLNSVEHRTWAARSLAHKCGQCGGSGEKR